MLVKNWMSQNVVSVGINDTMDYAIRLLKQQLQKKAALLYMVDHRENRREIFDDTPAAGRTGGRK